MRTVWTLGLRWQHLLPFFASVIVFLLAYVSPISYAGLDSHPSLLVSQSIIENKTSHLDAYLDSSTIDIDRWVARAPNGHHYYFWPIGTSALSVPYVWVLNHAGQDMSIIDSNHRAQNLLSAVLCAVVFLVIYQIGSCYLGPWPSLAISVISVLGSALISSMGTALWNIDFTILFISLSLLLICRFETGKSRSLHSYELGVFLFGAFFCRPTAAAFIVVILAYLLIKSRSTFVKTAVSAGTLLVLFVFWSWMELGTLVPQYYSSGAFGPQPLPPWLAALAHFFSPSRGIFIYSPFGALVLVVAAWLFRRLKQEAMLWVVVSWFVLHVIVASNAAMWWGGYSFGPRLNAEIIPGLVVITFLAWRELFSMPARRVQRAIAAGYLCLGILAIWINSGQGLWNKNTMIWNGGLMAPEIDTHPDYALDWKHPQFLATNRSLCDRNREHLAAYEPDDLIPYWLDDEVNYWSGMDEIRPATRQHVSTTMWIAHSAEAESQQGVARETWDFAMAMAPRMDNVAFLPVVARDSCSGSNALFIGWSVKEDGFRWTICRSAQIVLNLGSNDTARPLEMELLAGSFGPQEVKVLINGSLIGTLFMDTGPAFHTLQFSGTGLIQPGINVVEFQMPDAVVRDNSLDARLLGVQLVSFRIRHATAAEGASWLGGSTDAWSPGCEAHPNKR